MPMESGRPVGFDFSNAASDRGEAASISAAVWLPALSTVDEPRHIRAPLCEGQDSDEGIV